MAIIVDVNVQRFGIEEMLLWLRVERKVFAGKSVKAEWVSGWNFLRFNIDFSDFWICKKFQIGDRRFRGDSAGHLILCRLEGDSEVGLETRRVLDPLRLDLEHFAALGRETNRFLTFEANRVFSLADDDLFHWVSIFVRQNENGRPDRVDLKKKSIIRRQF